ncbi:MAG: dihydrolipoyl dehydrogenase [Candidatus Dadabacteria bacterium]|nr:dihydrolipoyl dehydrogenase [Candidatus Dadabacteria bacterium]MYA47662.1 dihydrolipoyl dehydrogenase [Candidatus Dadabacteria bacterium]MYG83543.1 dihydrolipoyl dehydrogenase [Candidatus Dadabacteria bacterium]MYK49762.1 dihydrolipoyl dehydrogenase [Candidatus Dadabacteria bacterium]
MERVVTEVAVIGAGPGGYPAAFALADKGKKVTLIDPELNPGGVCLYRGCIPSKALLHAAKVAEEARDAADFGLSYGEPEIDPEKLFSWKDEVVSKLTGGLRTLVKARKVNYLRGRASFTSSSTLCVVTASGEEREVEFQNAVISTGSVSRRIPGVDFSSPNVIDSDGALSLGEIPRSLLVVGGGYIGLELGTFFSSLGTEVTVVEMLPRLVQGVDMDLAAVLKKRLDRKFRSIMLETKLISINKLDNEVQVSFEADGKSFQERYEKVLISVGRVPNTEGLGLENTWVGVDGKGFIETDSQRRTADRTIFAIGDVAGEPMLAHKATYEAKIVAEVITGAKTQYDPRAVPAVIFTDPEIAWCGITESEAKESGMEVNVSKFPWAASGRALTLNRTDGLTKLITDKGTGRVVGVGIVGPQAGELISESVVAIEMGATAEDIAFSIHPHPTLTETIMEAAEGIYGASTHIMKRRPRKKSR